jgi:hypothetical protein
MSNSFENIAEYRHHTQQTSRRDERRAPQFELLTAELAQYARQGLSLEISFDKFPNNAKAIFDGVRIEINDRIQADQQAFILLHLIGHAAQLASQPELTAAARFDSRSYPESESNLRAYKRQALCYGAGLLITLDRPDLLPWFNRTAITELGRFIAFRKGDQAASLPKTLPAEKNESLFPLELPDFTPVRLSKSVVM